MTQNTQNPPIFPPLPEQLRLRLIDSLADYGGRGELEVFAEQAEILDRTFRHMLENGIGNGDPRWGIDAPRIGSALKAQNQYRYTVKALAEMRESTIREWEKNKIR